MQVKLSADILDSPLWRDVDERNIFFTACLLAKRRKFTEPVPQIKINSREPTGWVAPPGLYGYVSAVESAIARIACIPNDRAFAALERLGDPKLPSGPHLIHMAEGYIVLDPSRYCGRRERSTRFGGAQTGDVRPVTADLTTEPPPTTRCDTHRPATRRPVWSQQRFQFIADKIREWIRAQARGRNGTGPGEENFETAFLETWQMTYAYWLVARDRHLAFYEKGEES